MLRRLQNRLTRVAIKRIEVRLLFGHLDYDLVPENNSNNPDFLLLYGDNGSGKTTILKILFYLFSSVKGKSHKTSILSIKFNRYSVYLSDGSYVEMKRPKQETLGPYSIEVHDPAKGKETYKFEVESDAIKESPTVFKYLEYMESRNYSCLYLPDDRRAISTFADSFFYSSGRDEYIEYISKAGVLRRTFRNEDLGERSHHLDVSPILSAVEAQLRQDAISSTMAGEGDTASVYLKVIGQLSKPKAQASGQSTDMLISTLKDFGDEMMMLTRYGLLDEYPLDKFIHEIKSASEASRPAVSNVLAPFIEGLGARITKLRPLLTTMQLWEDTLQEYMPSKGIKLNLRDGFAFAGAAGEQISPNDLSSGEKQLIMLLGNTFLARRKAKIIIIDEPEISLNIKWQRQLLPTLHKFSESSRVQFIIATHSFEIIAPNEQYIVPLTPKMAST